MEQEVKIADLAKLWNISVNTTWKRVNKEGLRTIKKPVEGREITFVIVDDEILEKYQVHEGVISSDYEEILTDNNINEVKKPNNIDKILEYSKSINEQIISLNEDYNQRINTLNEELITYKSKNLLLEDKSQREGLYLQEINTLRSSNEQLKNTLNKVYILLSFITTLLIIIAVYTGYKLLIKI